jgi:hypothetical protein
VSVIEWEIGGKERWDSGDRWMRCSFVLYTITDNEIMYGEENGGHCLPCGLLRQSQIVRSLFVWIDHCWPP